MRVLSDAEFRELEENLGDSEADFDAELEPVRSLVELGYLSYREDEEYEYLDITDKGRAALRCHKAYLAHTHGHA